MTRLNVMSHLSTISSLSEEYERTLNDFGINSTSDLLERSSTKTSRSSLAKDTGIPENLILRWAEILDLERVKGIGMEYSELLEACEVRTIPELARRNPEHLFEKIQDTNSKMSLVKKLPTQKQVSEWISQAKDLPRIIFY